MDPSVANLYGRSGLSRRARPIPKLNLVNQDVQFSHHYPRVPRTEKPINRIRKQLYVNCGNTLPVLALYAGTPSPTAIIVLFSFA